MKKKLAKYVFMVYFHIRKILSKVEDDIQHEIKVTSAPPPSVLFWCTELGGVQKNILNWYWLCFTDPAQAA